MPCARGLEYPGGGNSEHLSGRLGKSELLSERHVLPQHSPDKIPRKRENKVARPLAGLLGIHATDTSKGLFCS